MKKMKKQNHTKIALFAGATALMALTPQIRAQSTDDVLINKLEQKGLLTVDEAKEIRAEAAAEQTNMVNSALMASKFKMADSIKNMQFYGDFRLRYEYRGVDNAAANIAAGGPSTFYRDRMRYALRFGIRGDLYDDFSYGIRLETSNNPRSPWDTFGNNTTGGSVSPSDKNTSGIYLGQAFLNWHPAAWYEMSAGRMPMPLYTTPMVWDSDINPEGALKNSNTRLITWTCLPISDNGITKTQFGIGFSKQRYVFTDLAGGSQCEDRQRYVLQGCAHALHLFWLRHRQQRVESTFVGQGSDRLECRRAGRSDVPTTTKKASMICSFWKYQPSLISKSGNTPLGTLQARLFGDFAYNFKGDDRARAAYNANPGAFPGLSGPVNGQDKAYQMGFGIGSAGPVYGPTQGLVYGSTSKKNTWEARVYWQHVEQYALDVNLLDSDFFEGRANFRVFIRHLPTALRTQSLARFATVTPVQSITISAPAATIWTFPESTQLKITMCCNWT